jgi:hypothetical protein
LEKQNVLRFLLPFLCPKPKFGALYSASGVKDYKNIALYYQIKFWVIK